MNVSLISSSSYPEKNVALAARVSCSSKSVLELAKELPEGRVETKINDAFIKGDTAAFKHAVYTFAIDGISSLCCFMLCSQEDFVVSKSSRSGKVLSLKEDFVIPRRFLESKELKQRYEGLLENAAALYEDAVRFGVSPADAEYILPASESVNVVISVSAAGLLRFFSSFCCKKAHWEIRTVAWKCLKEVSKVSPVIFEGAGPFCISDGICPRQDEKCFMKMKQISRGEDCQI